MSPQEKICRDIRERIRTGELHAGMRLTPHRDLSRKYGVAIATVTRAVRRLKREGLLKTERGNGTIVTSPPLSVGKNHKVQVINPNSETSRNFLFYAVNEVFIGSKWQVETHSACANLSWYASFLRECHRTPAAGLLLPAIAPEVFHYTPELLPHPSTRTVVIGHPIPGFDSDVVRSNPFGEGIMLGDYIARCGYRNMIYITPSTEEAKPEAATLHGLEQVLHRYGIPFGKENIRRYHDEYSYGLSPDPVRSAFEYTVEFLRSEPRPELILAGHDLTALGVYRALLVCGIKVPEDVSLISAEKGELSNYYPDLPQITTFDNLAYYQFRVAAELLLSRLQGESGPPRYHEIHGTLILGETSRKPGREPHPFPFALDQLARNENCYFPMVPPVARCVSDQKVESR